MQELGLVSSPMWVLRVVMDSMAARFEALVTMLVAPWRAALPILVMRCRGMSGLQFASEDNPAAHPPCHPHPSPLPSRERGFATPGIPRSHRFACSRPFRFAKGAIA